MSKSLVRIALPTFIALIITFQNCSNFAPNSTPSSHGPSLSNNDGAETRIPVSEVDDSNYVFLNSGAWIHPTTGEHINCFDLYGLPSWRETFEEGGTPLPGVPGTAFNNPCDHSGKELIGTCRETLVSSGRVYINHMHSYNYGLLHPDTAAVNCVYNHLGEWTPGPFGGAVPEPFGGVRNET